MKRIKVSHLIKEACVSCGAKLSGFMHDYVDRGNYCRWCTALANRVSTSEITQKAADKLLSQRRMEMAAINVSSEGA